MKPDSGERQADAEQRSKQRWVLVIIAICAAWLVAMVAASYLGLAHKTPVRIENWKPEPGPY